MKRCAVQAQIACRLCSRRFATQKLLLQQESYQDDTQVALRVRSLQSNARTLLKARRPQEAAKILDEGLNLQPWNGSLHFWKIATKLGSANAALDAWSTMLKLGIVPQAEHYDIISQALYMSDDAKHLLVNFFDDMQAQGMQGNMKFYQNLLAACTSDVLLDDMERIMTAIKLDARLNDIARHSTILRSFAAIEEKLVTTGRRDVSEPAIEQVKLKEAQQEQEREIAAMSNPQEQPDDTVTQYKGLSSLESQQVYDLISPFWSAKADQSGSKEAWAQARAVVKSSEKPSIESYHMLLRRADMVDSSEEVLSVLDDMDEAGMKATPITHRLAIASLLKRDDTTSAIELAQIMERSEGQLDAMVLINLIRSLCRMDQHDAALKFLRESMKSSEVDLSVNDAHLRIYNSLIEGLTDVGRVRDAEELVEEMCAECQPSIKTWQFMIDGYIKANRLADAAKAFSVIVEQPLLRSRSESADRRIDNIIASLVHAFLQRDMYHEAERFVSQCVEHNDWRSTNTKIWRHFIEYLCSPPVGRVGDAFDLFRFQLGRVPSQNRHFLYKDMIEYGCLNLSDTRGALTLLAEAKDKGIIFEQHEMTWFMHLAMQHGDRNLAEKILEQTKSQLESRGEQMGQKLTGTIQRWSL